ncbi:MAG TPA: lipopolysaccharide transport periplasmic protein LptA [Xanthobacteraceae bacterium]|nr:lipopolysaccharide transport periplasmic protein LptA [Xanthobacteraceae bacterium]
MKRHIQSLGRAATVLAVTAAAGWAAAAQTGGHAAPAAQGTPIVSPLFSQNSDQPIKIQSTSLEVRDKDHVATFIGNVHVVQGDSTMKCKTLVVFYDEAPEPASGQSAKPGSSNQQIKRLEAKGGVVVTQKDQTATGDNGEFDMKTNTAILTGNVVVTQGDNVIRGERLIVDMTTGISHVEAGKSGKGRVDALFKPNSQKPGSGDAAKETKPPAPLKIN